MLELRALKDLVSLRAAQGRAAEVGTAVEALVAELATAEAKPLEDARQLLAAVTRDG